MECEISVSQCKVVASVWSVLFEHRFPPEYFDKYIYIIFINSRKFFVL